MAGDDLPPTGKRTETGPNPKDPPKKEGSAETPATTLTEEKRIRRKLNSAAHEIRSIYDAGKTASKEPSKVSSFKGMYKALERYYALFEDLWEELTVLGETSGNFTFPSSKESEFKAEIRHRYYSTHSYYEDLKSEASPTTGVGETTVIADVSHSLPTMELPKFNGCLLSWPTFRDTFSTLVHDDSRMPNIRKYHYLRLSLEGPAATVINHLPLDDQSYMLAWQALRDTYDNGRLLASCQLDQILNFTPLTGKPSCETLKKFLQKVNDSVQAFKQLNVPNESAFILFHLAIRCLDQGTREKFELAHKKEDYPTFDQLITFVREQCLALELAGNISKGSSHSSESFNTSKNSKTNHFKKPWAKPTVLLANKSEGSSSTLKKSQPAKNGPKSADSTSAQCRVCAEKSHSLLNCKVFQNASVTERVNYLSNWSGCTNCLSTFHTLDSCASKGVCRWCRQRHNSMICASTISPTTTNSTPSVLVSSRYEHSPDSTRSKNSLVLIGTAVVQIQDGKGQYQNIRIALDSGSHYSFLTRGCLKRLGLEARPCSTRVSGIGQTVFDGSKEQIECTIRPQNRPSPTLSTTALVVKNITSFLPTVSLPYELWSKYLKFPLADPKFFESSPIDFLLGADLFADVWVGPSIILDDNSPKLFPTIFGHVIMGKFSTPSSHTDGCSLLALQPQDDLLTDMKKFWEIEEPTPISHPNPQDQAVEDWFQSSHSRDENGRYIVRLPFKSSPPDLTSISSTAKRCLFNLEEKLRRKPELLDRYHSFMQEYLDLGHMTECPTNFPKYLIPHHSVVKEDRGKIKLRVVFNASAKSTNGSLNDFLLVGPKLQTDLRIILLGFRTYQIVLVGDTVKMYRNILLHEADQPYQCIIWRFSNSEAIKTYKLLTVTYGLNASPFLALRTLKQLAKDEGTQYPHAQEVLLRDFYIDDFATGAETLEEALELQNQLVELLQKGGFTLSKWASNHPKLLEAVSEPSVEPISITAQADPSLKILGLKWDPNSDCFMYSISKPSNATTKRSILSAVARIYDPIGLLAPYVVMLKSFIQELWKLGLDWDQPIPSTLEHDWKHAVKDMDILGQLRIPRCVCLLKPYRYQIIGFCDASTASYAAAVYLRVISSSKIQVQLLTAKTKLAPLRILTIPRLELAGAHLLSQLYAGLSDFQAVLTEPCLDPCFFTDSQIVLNWLNTPLHLLKTWVSNRVYQITEVISPSFFRHVATQDNPADCASRGISPLELVKHPLWWSGPSWLSFPTEQWPDCSFICSEKHELPETKIATVLLASDSERWNFFQAFMARFSAYTRLLHVVARILRLANQARRQVTPSGPLRLHEIDDALRCCVKNIQLHLFFHGDIHNTQETFTRFNKLNPFFDAHGILRAGGRLYNADVPYNHKHPILLPPNCHFTDLLVDHFHRVYLHPGPSLLQALLQTRFWIPSLRRLVQKRSFLCLQCFKAKPKATMPLMGNLPASRLQEIRAFAHVGIDFAGPLYLRESTRRKSPVTKAYICLFICMSTKALHLEIVSSLSCDAFLAAFDRFISRRGQPSDAYSDNGSNFLAASNQLRELWQWFRNSSTQAQITGSLASKQIQWHFNPPRGPHFGGIWEAGVKSTKRLFRNAVGETALTFEEAATLLTRIEAILNSRPLTPLSNDPAETDYLSPAHFLIGCALTTPPEPSLLDCRLNSLDRWQLIKRMSQHFWNRWRIEYLSTLQPRLKWRKTTPNLQVGDLVLLKEDHAPFLQWKTARVLQLHPGKDDVVRVITVRTPAAVYKRPVAKVIALLPLSHPPYPHIS